MADSLTGILHDARSGDPRLAEKLFQLAYGELRRLAGGMLRAERPGHTLQATALVNEAYLKLLGEEGPSFESRAHFFAIAARVMRQILVDHARKHFSQKRGGGAEKLELNEGVAVSSEQMQPLLELNDALDALAQADPRKAQVIEMRFFAGMTGEEIAEATGLSTSTVARDLRMAQAWLAAHMGPGRSLPDKA
jgi:RNA polymerase sigma factor (TIGR02999 family)